MSSLPADSESYIGPHCSLQSLSALSRTNHEIRYNCGMLKINAFYCSVLAQFKNLESNFKFDVVTINGFGQNKLHHLFSATLGADESLLVITPCSYNVDALQANIKDLKSNQFFISLNFSDKKTVVNLDIPCSPSALAFARLLDIAPIQTKHHIKDMQCTFAEEIIENDEKAENEFNFSENQLIAIHKAAKNAFA